MISYRIGYLYAAGLGVSKDNSRAYAWLKLAAQNKNEQAKKDVARLQTELSSEDQQQGEIILQQITTAKSNVSNEPE